MKTIVKSFLVLCLITIISSCSKDDSTNDEVIRNSEVINYLGTPDSEGQLLSEVYVKEDNAITYFYGSTDSNGEKLLTQSLAYNVDNSNKIDYIVLDELQRVKFLYSEVNGVKEEEIISFTYPQEGLVNCLVISRDWNTLEDTILDFSTVETSGDDFIAHNLFGKIGNTKFGDEQEVVRTWLLMGVAIIAVVAATNAGRVLIAAGTLTAKQVAIRGAIAAASGAILASDSANGAEPDYQTPNPNAPTAPETNVIENQCTSSNLSVIIGVDPGNVLVVIVNGDSATYDFYWSTGETATTPITHVITAPDDGVYYVMVRDEKGCIAFASATIEYDVEVDPSLLTGKTWFLTGETENAANIYNPENCNITLEFNESQLISTEYFGDECESSDEIPSNYEVNGNIITETEDGDTSFITILELTPFKLVLQEVDGSFTYVETYTNIFGNWTFAENSNCVVSNGETFTDNGSGELLTLNDNYTAVLPDDSNGNYLSNGFTFENSILTINLSYQDFFSPACDGVNFQTAMNSITLTYDNATNTFTGTSQSSRNDVIGSDCTRLGETCTGTITMSR